MRGSNFLHMSDAKFIWCVELFYVSLIFLSHMSDAKYIWCVDLIFSTWAMRSSSDAWSYLMLSLLFSFPHEWCEVHLMRGFNFSTWAMRSTSDAWSYLMLSLLFFPHEWCEYIWCVDFYFLHMVDAKYIWCVELFIYFKSLILSTWAMRSTSDAWI